MNYRTKAQQSIDSLRALSTISKILAPHPRARESLETMKEYDKKILESKITIDSFLALDDRDFKIEGLRQEIPQSLECHVYAAKAMKDFFVESNDEMFDKVDDLRKEANENKKRADAKLPLELRNINAFESGPLISFLLKKSDSHLRKADELLKEHK